ncbi:hypothetical protein QO002_001151 [Pararhizobium capsulatum DSM 1112]|uniref:Gfo/Idh/MocA-like oxidoreductase N-terminal domain-containing protein n=1 Tax=Pararhizobium capsulatum DSM 1112 TaxID=1121113 RepID=A0ABU0BM59_9HYPH|nr:hypothetical protein [Pararhizobium capsulatum]MDQ0319013.1 hypothetical protein [Pararhizobium capsulatum DSM 1112]
MEIGIIGVGHIDLIFTKLLSMIAQKEKGAMGVEEVFCGRAFGSTDPLPEARGSAKAGPRYPFRAWRS